MRDRRQLDVSPRRIDVLAHDSLVTLLGRGLELGLAGQPEHSPFTHCDSRKGRVDVRSGVLRVLDAIEKAFGVDLAVERLVALLAGWRAVVRSPDGPVVPNALLDAGHGSSSPSLRTEASVSA